MPIISKFLGKPPEESLFDPVSQYNLIYLKLNRKLERPRQNLSTLNTEKPTYFKANPRLKPVTLELDVPKDLDAPRYREQEFMNTLCSNRALRH